MLRRARARYMSVPLAVSLAELRSPLEQAYRNTVYCSGTLQQDRGQLTARYCGNRWCLVCNRIRTARAMNRYLPVVDTWAGKQLVTLTLRNVPAEQLSDTLKEMVRAFQSIKLGMKRSRTQLLDDDGTPRYLPAMKLVALRKLECTYNRRRDDYHPHFHIVTESLAMADALRERWLDYFGDRVDAQAQHVVACDQQSMREVFKYFTKLMAKQRGTANAQGKSLPVDPRALDNIFCAMRRQRVYQSVGFTVAPEAPDENEETLTTELATPALVRPTERILWEWNQAVTDWIDKRTGECLTGYEPAEKFKRFVEKMRLVPLDAPDPDNLPPIKRLNDRETRELCKTVRALAKKRLQQYAYEQQVAGRATGNQESKGLRVV